MLPEHSGQHSSCSTSISSSSSSSRLSPHPRSCRSDASSSCSSSVTSSTSSSRQSPTEKRRSRYGRDEFDLDPNFLCASALDTSSPAPGKQKHQTFRLSVLEIDVDIASTTTPVGDASTMTMLPRITHTRNQRPTSPSSFAHTRTRSHAPACPACSRNDVPITPLTFDYDEWLGLNFGPSSPQRGATKSTHS